jgi:murein DD-endopeptidase MepM/ murein hydrolase activator NlpD
LNAQSSPLPGIGIPASHWDGDAAADIFAACGTPVKAVFDGVSTPQDMPLGGNTIVLTAADGTEAYYAHLQPNRVSGQVSAGQTIGYVSDSGNAQGTGCHLHFAVGRINSNGGGTYNVAEWLSGQSSGVMASIEPALILGGIVILALVIFD